MSTADHALSLREAREVAATLIEALRPYCERVEVAGSIRRGKPFVNDIEIVCVPRTLLVETVKPEDLFSDAVEVAETNRVRVPGFVNTVHEWQLKSLDTCLQEKTFGDPWKGKYVKFNLVTGTQVDLFITTPEQWGYIFTIRTGSADFMKMIAGRWVKLGYKGIDGELTRGGTTYQFPEEADLFGTLGLRVPPPQDREMTADGISKWIVA